jgi:Polysulphide reductase, NrfD
LISDLGRPTRFLNMLRMFKVTSPMSVGSWILSVSGATTSVAAANAWLGLFPRLARVASPAAALAGLPLSTYTAALFSNTAVPAWHEARRMMPLMFGSGAALSAGAAALIATPLEAAAPARRLALAGAVAELGVKEMMERRLKNTGETYKKGAAGKFGRFGQACLIAGAGALVARGSRSRPAAAAAGGLMLTGALSARWSVFKAGFNSVSDPAYVVRPQRERIERGERAGAARTARRVDAPAPATASPATASLGRA